MPRKRYGKRKRTTKRTPNRRRRYRTRKYGTIPSGMPLARRANLRYCEQLTMTCTSGILEHYIFRANSVFDPNQSGIGHQPMGYDQWALLYNNYNVVGSKIQVRLTGDTSISAPIAMGVFLTDYITPPYADWTGYKEGRKGSVITYTGRNSNVYKAQSKFSAKKYFNLKDVKDNTHRTGAGTGTNPTEEAYYIIWLQTLNATTDTFEILVQVDYIVDFSDPKELAQS